MPIRVAHNVGADAIGLSALLAGQGQYRRYIDEFNQRERMQANQIAAQQAEQQTQIDAQRERDYRQQNFQALKDEMDSNDKFAFLNQQFQNSQKAADAELERENKRTEFGYTAKQKYEAQQLQNTLDNIEKRDDLSPEEKAYAKKSVQEKMMGIKPMPLFHDDKPDINAQWDKRVKYDNDNGVVAVMQPDGTVDFKPLPKPKEPAAPKTPKDLLQDPNFINKLHKEAYEEAAARIPDDQDRQPTDEEVQAIYDRKKRFLMKEIGREVPASQVETPVVPPFDPKDTSEWTPEMHRAAFHAISQLGTDREHSQQELEDIATAAAKDVYDKQFPKAATRASAQLREPSPMVGGAMTIPNADPRDMSGTQPISAEFPGSAGAPADEVSMRAMTDPALQHLGHENRLQIAQEATAAKDALSKALATGVGVEDAKARVAAIVQLIEETAAAHQQEQQQQAVLPPQAPPTLIAPPQVFPTTGKPSMAGPIKRTGGTMTVRGKTVEVRGGR